MRMKVYQPLTKVAGPAARAGGGAQAAGRDISEPTLWMRTVRTSEDGVRWRALWSDGFWLRRRDSTQPRLPTVIGYAWPSSTVPSHHPGSQTQYHSTDSTGHTPDIKSE